MSCQGRRLQVANVSHLFGCGELLDLPATICHAFTCLQARTDSSCSQPFRRPHNNSHCRVRPRARTLRHGASAPRTYRPPRTVFIYTPIIYAPADADHQTHTSPQRAHGSFVCPSTYGSRPSALSVAIRTPCVGPPVDSDLRPDSPCDCAGSLLHSMPTRSRHVEQWHQGRGPRHR